MESIPAYDPILLRHLAGEIITNVRELAQAGRTPATSSNFTHRLDDRPAAITECELLLVMDQGMRRAFGPRDEVLKSMVKNADQIARAQGQGHGGGVT